MRSAQRLVVALVVLSIAALSCDSADPDRSTRALASSPAGSRAHSNILLIVVDTLRADHLRSYEPSSRPTPNLDALAGLSHRFEIAVAQAPCTKPSMWNIVTSRYQAEVPLPVTNEPSTMAATFKALGYRTVAYLNKSKLGTDPGLRQGFDRFSVGASNEGSNEVAGRVRTPRETIAGLGRWIDEPGEGPFFAWLVLNDPHRPYRPPAPYRGKFTQGEAFDRDGFRGGPGAPNKDLSPDHAAFLRNAYDEEVDYVDAVVGELVAMLRDRDLFESTLIVFTADHGEELGEAGGRWSHCIRCSLEEAHVPLLIKLPGQRDGRVIESPAQLIDIFPTLVRHLEAEMPASLQGTSLLPAMRGEATSRVAACFWETSDLRVTNDHALETEKSGDSRLFSLETRELIEGRPDLEVQIVNASAEASAAPDEQLEAQRELMIEQMRAIGYIE